MRRSLVVLSIAAVVAAGAGPVAADGRDALDVTVERAPVAPDGTTAGSITDVVLTFADRDPRVDGIGLLAGATVTATLPDGFVDVGGVGPNTAILLQGWPQSPPAPPPAFPWTTTVDGNTITATLTADFPVGATGPGTKQLHLLLNTFRNPSPGSYGIELSIRPDVSSPRTLDGTGIVHIIPEARPGISAVSVFSGGAPPPLNNAIHQFVAPGDVGLDVGLYLWERGSFVADGISNPAVGVDLTMDNPRRGRLVAADGRTVGRVGVAPPRGADDFALTTGGPSTADVTFITGFDAGVLLTSFHTDPDVVGTYVIDLSMNGGNTQRLFVTAE